MRLAIGLKPRNAANSALIGGMPAIPVATAAGMPSAVRCP